jgi:V8-like Glu-specific endopeptidase
MRYKSFYILSTLVIISCKKEDKKESPNYDCSNLITQFNSSKSSNNNSNSSQYIANGCENNVNDIPGSKSTVYVSHEKGRNYYACTGVVISDHYVLTAAHCLNRDIRIDNKELSEKVLPKEISIMSNDNIQKNNYNYVKKIRVIDTFIHPMYQHNIDDVYISLGDIAIIKTASSLSNLKTIPIKAAKFYKEGEKVLSIGYGRIEENNSESVGLKRWTLSTLRKAKQNFPFESFDIQRYHDTINKKLIDYSIAPSLQDSFLIMNRENNYEGQTCKGDSGGPQFINRENQAVLISITQGFHYKLVDHTKTQKNGDDCIKYGSSSNTYVAPYINWINSILEQSNEKLEYIENL